MKFYNFNENLIPILPHAFGELIEVPFNSWFPLRENLATPVIAAPGAAKETPIAPSAL